VSDERRPESLDGSDEAVDEEERWTLDERIRSARDAGLRKLKVGRGAGLVPASAPTSFGDGPVAGRDANVTYIYTAGYEAARFIPRQGSLDPGAPKAGIGSTDAELLARWPGLAFDNTRDYITVSFGGTAKRLPAGIMGTKGPDLHRLVGELTTSWHPDLRTLFALADPMSFFPLHIRTSVPLQQWETTNITLLGDAIHTMTPGRGVGANTALRDARLLCDTLTAARDGQTPLLAAIRDYETQMIGYGFDAVKKSRKGMTANQPLHKPVIGRAVLAGMRTGMRTINHLPPVKNRMARAQRAYRGHDRED